MGDSLLVAVLDSVFELLAGVLILCMVLGWALTVLQLFDSRRDVRDLEAMLATRKRPRVCQRTAWTPPEPVVSVWATVPDPDARREFPDDNAPEPLVLGHWPYAPPTELLDATLDQLGVLWDEQEAAALADRRPIGRLTWDEPPDLHVQPAAVPVENAAYPPVTSDENAGQDQVEPARPYRWWLCPNRACGHGSVLHDIKDYEDDTPRCCVDGCGCGAPEPGDDGEIDPVGDEIPPPGEGDEGPPEHQGPDAAPDEAAAGEGATTPAAPTQPDATPEIDDYTRRLTPSDTADTPAVTQ